MAIKKIQGGRYFSTVTGQTYETEAAAEHADTTEAMRRHAKGEAGRKLLDKLTPQELESLHHALAQEASELTGREDWEANQQEFIAREPRYEATQANAGALLGYIVSRGYRPPVSVSVLLQAFDDLVEQGLIIPKKLPKGQTQAATFDLEAAEQMSDKELEARARGWM